MMLHPDDILRLHNSRRAGPAQFNRPRACVAASRSPRRPAAPWMGRIGARPSPTTPSLDTRRF